MHNKISWRQFLMGLLIIFCVFSNTLPFLNIDLNVIILTPRRFVLLLASVMCFVRLLFLAAHHELLPLLKAKRMSLLFFTFLSLWAVCGAAWLVFGHLKNALAPTEFMGIVELTLFSFCFLVLLQDRSDLWRCAQFLLLCGLVLSLMADVEIVIGAYVKNTAGNISLPEKLALGRTLFPPSAVFNNTNDLASFLLLCLAIQFYRILLNYRAGLSLRDGIILFLLLLPTPVINSTIFHLALFSMTVLVLAILLRLYRGQYSAQIKVGIGVPSALLAYLLPFDWLINYIGQKLNTLYYAGIIQQYLESSYIDSNAYAHTDSLLTQLAAAESGYGTIHIRLWLLRAGADFFLHHPLLGCGPGQFRVYIEARPDYIIETRNIVDPHNFYVELAVQYGIFFFLFYMGLFLSMLFLSTKRALQEVRLGLPAKGVYCLLVVIAFAFASIMPSSIIRLSPIWLHLFLAVAMFDSVEG